MYEPKAVDFITSNGKHILIYDYLNSLEFTIKLANDLVVAVEPLADDVTFLMEDEHGVYDTYTNVISKKPSKLVLDLHIRHEGLLNIIENEPLGFKKMSFIHKTRFTP